MFNIEKYFFYKNNVDFSNDILKLILLDTWSFIIIQGQDSKIFLQNQLTIDIDELDNHPLCFFNALHCNVKGKILTNMHIFKYKYGYCYIVKKNIVKYYLNQIKKYRYIYKIDFLLQKSQILLGVSGINSNKILSQIFNNYDFSSNKQNLFIYNNNIFLKFMSPIKRYFMILDKKHAKLLIKYLIKRNILVYDSDQWTKFYMEIGYPIFNKDNSIKFFAQESNMEVFNAINFNKGCYLGQEIISISKIRKKKNKSLFLLEGSANFMPSFYDELEFYNNQKNDIYKIYSRGGILSAIKFNNNIIWIQAILKKEFQFSSSIKLIKDKHSNFCIKKFN
ncbi:tRNA-modifying protein YgfZ [Enterobacteriaceae endosymbiont of Plateumaris consimilis]|uniref:tRNA-modifying protein YgfZ n=1 Tax=Enterobacteriaceae endosymbiont of Plateumaris consimilis TaxID=2675794 RepID=UPI001449D4E7|nr:tRNA-modifying protein YgfZ [Enterobacteriaceae endosymbiont of Plateumaris consimilis]QJC28598.1 tRNA-modifying protein YgfZ [Enterobacteriaceae endosymbiont of Plateumaris consimilis]